MYITPLTVFYMKTFSHELAVCCLPAQSCDPEARLSGNPTPPPSASASRSKAFATPPQSASRSKALIMWMLTLIRVDDLHQDRNVFASRFLQARYFCVACLLSHVTPKRPATPFRHQRRRRHTRRSSRPHHVVPHVQVVVSYRLYCVHHTSNRVLHEDFFS